MPMLLPEDVLTEDQKLWLGAVYELESSGRQYSYRALRAKLIDKLPKDFQPRTIDNRILSGPRLTLLGVAIVDPSAEMISITERVIRYIRGRLLDDPSQMTFTADEIANGINLEPMKVKRALSYMNDLTVFFNSARSSGAPGTLESMDITTDEAVESYLSFEALQGLFNGILSRIVESTKNREDTNFGVEPDARNLVNLQFEPNTAFILMSMSPSIAELDDVRNTIKAACEIFDIQATRVDEIEHSGVITELILKKIASSEFLIADLSGERPNVYYEVGYAHALGKRPILLRKAGTSLHFDLSVHNVPEYRNMTELQELLRRRLEAITGRHPRN